MRDVFEGVAHEGDDVVVRESVHDVPALATTRDEVLLMEQPQSVGHGRCVLGGGVGDLADAKLILGQQLQGPQARLVPEGAKQPSGSGDVRIRELGGGRRSMLPGDAIRGVVSFLRHLNN